MPNSLENGEIKGVGQKTLAFEFLLFHIFCLISMATNKLDA